MRVASYNVHRAVGTDGRQDFGRVAAVIHELAADVVGLQEVEWRHDGEESQFEHLAHLPGYQAVAGSNIRDRRGHYGNVLLSRLPARAVRRVAFESARWEPRGAVDAEVGESDARLRVIVTHLGLFAGERWRQAVRLRQMIGERPGLPTVLLADLNEWIPCSPTLRPLLRLCQPAARPATFPSSRPILALDRILSFALPAYPAVRVHASPLARVASDHLPLVAEIRVTPPAAVVG